MREDAASQQEVLTGWTTRDYWIVATALAVASLIGVFMAVTAHAGSGGSGLATAELEDIFNYLRGWTEGSIGKIITLAVILVGAAAAVMERSMWAFVVGLAIGLGLYSAPGVVTALFSATV